MNFLCISSYGEEPEWVLKLENPHIIYNKTGRILPSFYKNVVNIPNKGYNIYSMLRFIVDFYENLPEVTVFCKSNVFPRHVSREFFLSIKENQNFTGIFQKDLHNPGMPSCRFSTDGYWEERNDSWYMREGREMKYYENFNTFFEDFFDSPVLPYIKFTPGANFIVPKTSIQRFSKTFYENLLPLVSYTELPGEAHIVERVLHGMWEGLYIPSRKIINTKIIV